MFREGDISPSEGKYGEWFPQFQLKLIVQLKIFFIFAKTGNRGGSTNEKSPGNRSLNPLENGASKGVSS